MILDGKLSQEYPFNIGVPQSSILAPIIFLPYNNDFRDGVICNVATYADDNTPSVIEHLICGNKWILLPNLNLIYETL